jgi:hypothetical protein
VLFTKKLRALVKSGEVTASVRIWKAPHVKVGGKYRLEEGQSKSDRFVKLPGRTSPTD